MRFERHITIAMSQFPNDGVVDAVAYNRWYDAHYREWDELRRPTVRTAAPGWQ